ncbi:MAG: hypothetical protein HOJ85_15820 [Ilumatobacter sp.]|jgi:hypothetical protein|uniref:hypothetical protein n=1 Tax=Ilumatobacter sp. TaxID=1967498 RepID=UPI001D87CDFA|nr:hypothetical protein [Ilumatobacter sp.]MBT5277245.1 hypothetical protein [Ilumatobacter sp.]MBT5555215.1 hypothetical protein [Ilumatobacter sp.]MBT5866529.1 hypothetical protein [Ilumatobacter sp.]MDG0975256.1 hypothetical protein [Ilumatobacter sp.]
MAWDKTRPVPWQRLMREWLIYAVIMTAVFLLIFNDGNTIGAVAGVLVSGPLYLGFGWLLAKFGYQRKTLKEMRTPQASSASSDDDRDGDANATRRSVAPTSRTAGGGNRPPAKKNRRR